MRGYPWINQFLNWRSGDDYARVHSIVSSVMGFGDVNAQVVFL